MQTLSDLNDFFFIAAIAEKGSLAGAAKHLKVNHSTVFRHLESLEKQLGVKLFERENGRYLATLAGEEFTAVAAEILQKSNETLRKVSGRDLQPKGEVRITTTETIASSMILSNLKQIRESYPEIKLRLSTANEIYNLSKRDADIAIRPTMDPPDHLMGKLIGPLVFAVYGAKSYLQSYANTPLAEHNWIALDDSMSNHLTLKWLSKIQILEQVALRTNNFNCAKQACIEGLGITLLPCFYGDEEASLERMTDPLMDCKTNLWLLMHRDLRETMRVKVVMSELHTILKAKSKAIAGIR